MGDSDSVGPHRPFQYGPELTGRTGLLIGVVVVLAEVFYLTYGWYIGALAFFYVFRACVVGIATLTGL